MTCVTALAFTRSRVHVQRFPDCTTLPRLHEASQRLLNHIQHSLFGASAWVFAYQLHPFVNPPEELARVQYVASSSG